MTTTSVSLVCDCCARMLSRQLSRAQRYVFELKIEDVPKDVAARYRELMDITADQIGGASYIVRDSCDSVQEC
jgi:hypothetical protein